MRLTAFARWSLLFRAAGWLVVLVIVVLSLLPVSGQGRPDSGLPGGVEHLLAYLGAAVLLAVGYPAAKTQINLAVVLIALSGALEIFQLWVPGRHSELAGFFASASGAALGMVVGAAGALQRNKNPI